MWQWQSLSATIVQPLNMFSSPLVPRRQEEVLLSMDAATTGLACLTMAPTELATESIMVLRSDLGG